MARIPRPATVLTSPVDVVLSKLQRVTKNGQGWMAECPAHEDRKNSLGVREGQGRRALLNCLAGCDTEAVVAALDLTMADLFAKEKPAQQRRSRVIETYPYKDEKGDLLFEVCRKDDKTFPQRKPDGTWGINDVRRVLYRLPELIAADAGRWVLVPEGEKDVHALVALDFVATTNPGGADGWKPEFAESLRGRMVALLPDSDPPGRRRVRQAAADLHGVAAEVKVIELPGLTKEMKDVSDWLKAGHTAAELKELIRNAPDWEPTTTPDPEPDPEPTNALGTLAADHTMKPVKWLWKYRLASGMATMLDGDPGDGKSSLVANVAAHVTTGTPWPDGSSCPQGSVILVGAEDSIEQTIIPRLTAAGADLSKVVLITTIDTPDGPRLPSLPEDVPLLEAAIRKMDARLIVFDPITVYLANGLDAFKDKDVRRALSPLGEMLDRTSCCALMLRHFAKDNRVASALYRGLNSIAFIAFARTGMAVVRDKEATDTFLLVMTKSNLGPRPRARRYQIEEVDLGGDIVTSRIVFGEETDHQADELVTQAGVFEKKKDSAKGLLLRLVADGPVESEQILEAFDEAGISRRTAFRVKKDLGIKATKTEFTGRWSWALTKSANPDPENPTGEECHPPAAEDGPEYGETKGARLPLWHSSSSLHSSEDPPAARRVQRGDPALFDADDRCTACGEVDYEPLPDGQRRCKCGLVGSVRA